MDFIENVSYKDSLWLLNQLELGMISHAYLFFGADRQSQKKAMRDFISHVAAKKSKSDMQLIKEQIAEGVFAELFEIDHENAGVGIDDVLAFLRFLSTSSRSGQYKFAVLYGAESMSEAAQNALLKAMEEPIGDYLILLGALSRDSLSVTVQSRLSFVQLTEETDANLQPSLIFKNIEGIILEGNDTLAFSCAAEVSADKTKALTELESLYREFVDYSKSNAGQNAALMRTLSKSLALRMARLCLEAVACIRQNVSAKLAIECMFIQMQEVYHAENSRSSF